MKPLRDRNTDKSEMECQIFFNDIWTKIWFNNDEKKLMIIIIIKESFFRDGSNPADIIYDFYGCPRNRNGTLYFFIRALTINKWKIYVTDF